MTRWIAVAVWAWVGCSGGKPPTPTRPPGASHAVTGPQQEPLKLVVLVVFDQFPQWAFERYRDALSPNGFLRGFAAESIQALGVYPYAATMTAVGHTTLATGVLPSAHGIASNSVYAQRRGQEQGVFVGGGGDASSGESASTLVSAAGSTTKDAVDPRAMRVETAFDQLVREGMIGRVVALSLKDRGAVALGGKRANVAVWEQGKPAAWVSSSYYGAALPAWVSGAEPGALFALARRAIDAEGLGRAALPDVLAISVSTPDYVGHAEGVESAAYMAALRAADEALGAFVRDLSAGSAVVVLTSDHGSAPLPETTSAPDLAAAWHGDDPLPSRHAKATPAGETPRGRFDEDAVAAQLDHLADKTFGAGSWVAAAAPPYIYFGADGEALPAARRRELMALCLGRLRNTAGVWRAYEVDAHGVVLPAVAPSAAAPSAVAPGVAASNAASDELDDLVARSVPPNIEGDIYLVLAPFWIFSAGTTQGTHHGTPWRYDREVPIAIWPATRTSIAAGATISTTDIAAELRRIVRASAMTAR